MDSLALLVASTCGRPVLVLALLAVTSRCGADHSAGAAATEPRICGWIYSPTTPPVPVYGACINPIPVQPEFVRNGSFESWPLGFDAPPEHWEVSRGPAWGVSLSRSTEAFHGSAAVRLFEPTDTEIALLSAPFPSAPGHRPFVHVKWSGSSAAELQVTVQWTDQTGVPTAQSTVSAPALDTTWRRVEVGPAPAGSWAGTLQITKSAGSSAYVLVDAAGVLFP